MKQHKPCFKIGDRVVTPNQKHGTVVQVNTEGGYSWYTVYGKGNRIIRSGDGSFQFFEAWLRGYAAEVHGAWKGSPLKVKANG